ncbi:MAG: DUF4129 domain-containing protein [Geodermatophilaceae bacterium]|nr:DUF4129 domain-containing protein [Geodermatophilaceae bacterium]
MRGPVATGWPRLSLTLTVAMLLVALALVARAGPYTLRPSAVTATATEPTRAPPAPPLRTPDPRGEVREEFSEVPGVREVLPANVLVVATTILLVVLMACAVLSLLGILPRPRSHRRGSPGRPGEPSPVRLTGQELALGVEEALVRLEHGAARDAVVECWLLLLRVAGEAGSTARPSETAREYAERLSAEQLISPGPLARLAELYREARFSRHPVGPELRAEARRALGVLQTELRSGVRL